MSLSFDALAEHFDAQRGLPAQALRELVRAFDDLGQGDSLAIVEPGIGTGRISLPLAVAGHRITGIDISRPMLEACATKAAALRVAERVHLLEGDATALPVADGRFDAGIIASLLYLVPAWERVLDELGRVVRPGGAIILVRERTEQGEALRQWDAAWRERIEATGFRHQPLSPSDDEIIAAMETRWGTVHIRELASWRFGQSVAEARRGYGSRLRPLYGSIDDATWEHAVDDFLAWTDQTFHEPGVTLLEGMVHLELIITRVP